jgi:hypothetical protein
MAQTSTTSVEASTSTTSVVPSTTPTYVEPSTTSTSVVPSSTTTITTDNCEGNFDCDFDVDGSDASMFKSDFGRSSLSNPCPAADPCYLCYQIIHLPKTGQTSSYDTGDDGDLEKGAALPKPRFNDNGDGTVTDNLTGLIWLKDAARFGIRRWGEALADGNGLQDGQCGPSDGSISVDWRLPNRVELESLLDIKFYSPALSNTMGTGQWSQNDPFNNVQSSYWTSSTGAYMPAYAWCVDMLGGIVTGGIKDGGDYVWPVRGGY